MFISSERIGKVLKMMLIVVISMFIGICLPWELLISDPVVLQEMDVPMEEVSSTVLQKALDITYELESSSGVNNVGDKGKSIGPLHIHKINVDDVNRIMDYQAYNYDDRWSLEKSCEIFGIYLAYYGEVYTQKTGNLPSVETYVRIWNGGEHGWKSDSTLAHWQRAKKLQLI